ncbi:DUF5105 domain-containing protein [Lentibacillus sp. L22]|uniref:DUF5105 domain-containing protein n=1 Tax=Lentibacillus TaxID=175304 RepID=UPI0022B12CAA|nr:DUF5105 domain-containing protein [Lentibacillus daqui]
MKKAGILLFCCLLIVALTACGKSKDKKAEAEASTSSETIEASIEDASYILSGKDDGVSGDDDQDGGLLKIDLKLKNISDSSINVFPNNDIQLYDGDNQLDPVDDTNPRVDLKGDTMNEIGVDKQKQMTVLFDVDKDKKYEINISPKSSDYSKETEDVQVPLDTSNYNDSLKSLQDPGKALKAYIETIYFDKENNDYEKYVSADKDGIQDDAKNQFKDNMETILSKDVSDSKMEEYYDSFKQASAEKDKVETKVIANANDKAYVKVEYSVLSMDDIDKEITEYKSKYREKHDDFDVKKEEKYALSKFDSILDDLEAKSATQELEIEMVKKDDKWVIDDSEDANDRLMRVFAKGSVR